MLGFNPSMPAHPPILLAAVNARHGHASLGARCLLANMGVLRPQTALAEFTVQQSAAEIAQAIAALNPRILGLGVYVWNAALVSALLPLLRTRLPDLLVVLGGPEIAGPTPPNADFLLLGEGDLAFPALCRDILLAPSPRSRSDFPRAISPPLPDLSLVQLPYDEYSDSDLAHRTLYVESSRGCAMRCDYCVSSIDPSVRFFPLPPLLAAFDRLLARGARQFKFCDRSFNLHVPRAVEILSFFLDRIPSFPGLFLHLEMLPDRFPPELRAILSRFPPRSLQLEIGIQSFNPSVLDTIRRPQNLDLAADNLRFLRANTHAFIHADLIAGLPAESPASFAAGFDRLFSLQPHEIQLGILKKLPGAPIARHDVAFSMRYSPSPPYPVLSSRDWPADHLLRTARFAHWWDAFVSSNRFLAAAPLVWNNAPSVFAAFMEFSDWMGDRFPREHGIPLAQLLEALFDFLVSVRLIPPETAADALVRGYRHAGARDLPPALAPHLRHAPPPPAQGLSKSLRRQDLFWSWLQA